MSLHVRLASVLALLLVLLAPVALAQSQATTGLVEGTVTDPSGAVMPGVSVTLTNTATNYEKTLTTDDRGRYRAPLLPLGPYKVSASLDGFATLVREGLELNLGATLTVNIQMQVKAAEEEIVVTSESPLIETSSPQNTTKIDRDTLDGIPNNGRNFLELTKLTPGVALVQGPDGDELSVNGQKGIQNNISVDGADFNNPFFGEQRGGQRPAFTFNLDAVQEFVVIADGAPAEFGRASSGFVTVVTKSGTNDTSGTVHLVYKDDSLSTEAKRSDGTSEPKFDFQKVQAGFTLGGPLKADQIFYFASLDTQQGDETKQKDPSRIEQRVVNAFAALGSPNENGPIERTNDAIAFLGKIDWQASNSNLLTARFNYTDAEQANGTFDVDSWGRSANATEKDNSWAISGTAISNIGNSLLNELRFQYAIEERPRPYEGPNNTRTGRPLPDTAFDFGSSYRFGMPFFIPVIYDDTRYQLNDNVSWLRGAHSFKAGVEYNRTEAFQTFVGFANGRYIFSSTDGFLNFLANPKYVECSNGTSSQTGICPAGTEITGPVLLYLQQAGVGNLTATEAGTQTITQQEPAAFIQDSWQPNSRLTVQLGLRWEAQIQPDVITPADEVFFSDFIGETSLGQKFPSNGEIPSDYGMWQPRLGIAWDPFGKGETVVRASAGLYYARIPGLTLASTRSTNGSRGQTLFRNSALTGILGPVPTYGELIPQSQVGAPFRPDVFVFDEDFQNPDTTALALAVEHQLAPGVSVLYKFNYAKTEHLTRFVNRNDALLGSPWTSGLNGTANGIGTLTTVESTAQSLYRGHTVGLTYRSRPIEFQAFYTYSKDKSDDDNERDPFSFRYAKVTDLDAEWGYSDRDQRHRANAWMLWHAPYGINVNARYSYRSAQPRSLTASGAIANSPQDRINPDGSVTQRNLGRKDNQFSSLDLRVSKSFHIGGYELEAILDGFNLFNSTNQKAPQVTNLIFNFDGTVQSGLGDPRQFQLGLRFVF